jgi:hypothetical protein
MLRPNSWTVAWCTLYLALLALAGLVGFVLSPDLLGQDRSEVRLGIAVGLCLLAVASRWIGWLFGDYDECE